MRIERLARLVRFLHPSAWRFLALTGTDPSLDRLFELLRTEKLPALLDRAYPRFSLGAVEYIETETTPQMRVLEWGSGSSTVWFAKRGHTIVSIEHDPVWHRLVSARIAPPSTVLRAQLGEEYARPVATLSEFDLICIDGRCRGECATFVFEESAKGQLRPGTTIVFDDSERPRYRATLEQLAMRAKWHWTFGGTSGVVLGKTTSIFRL